MKNDPLYRRIGIYQIRNTITNDIYVGSSASAIGLYRRRREHFKSLRLKRHGNRFLQSAWNKYGAENFVFEIIEECPKEIILQREDFYIQTLKPRYNLSYSAVSPGLGKFGYEHSFSKEVICVNDGKLYGSFEEAAREYKVTGSDVRRVVRHEQFQIKGLAFALPDDTEWIESRKQYLQSEAFKLKLTSKNKRFVCVNDGKTFWKSSEAAEFYNIPGRSVRNCLQNKITCVYGKSFAYVHDIERIETLKKFLLSVDYGSKGRSTPCIRSDGRAYASYSLAAKELGTSSKMIGEVISGRRKSIKGFSFKRIEEA